MTCVNITKQGGGGVVLQGQYWALDPRGPVLPKVASGAQRGRSFLNAGIQGLSPPPFASAPSGTHGQILMSPKDVGAGG